MGINVITYYEDSAVKERRVEVNFYALTNKAQPLEKKKKDNGLRNDIVFDKKKLLIEFLLV